MCHANRSKSDWESGVTFGLFQDLATVNGIEIQISPTEAHNAMGMGERYHAPPRRIYQVLQSTHPSLDEHVTLRPAIKGMNDTLGPNELVLLVLGFIQWLSIRNKSLPSRRDRMEALSLVGAGMDSINAELKICRAISSKLTPATKYDYSAGNDVRVDKGKNSGESNVKNYRSMPKR